MDSAGFCFEPDVRFSGHVLRPADSVVFYACGQGPIAPSPIYLAAATITRLGIIVASADGAVVPEEQAHLRERTAKAIDLSADESRRLQAYVEWLLDTPIPLDALEAEGTRLGEEDRLRVGRFLIAVAGADGYISTPERWILAGTFRLFGLGADELDAEISSFIRSSERREFSLDADESPPSALRGGTVQLSSGAIQEVLNESVEAIENLAGLMPVAPIAPSPGQVRLISEVIQKEGQSKGMDDWEQAFAQRWRLLSATERRRAGSLLGLVPPRAEWQEFIAAWKAWPLGSWIAHKADYPHALAVLFGGLAFYEYEETAFWPQFERKLWPLSPNQRVTIRTAHASALERTGLRMVRNQTDDRMTVASAVHHIGVPLSLWADFLGVADHILRQPDWRSWTSEQWAIDVSARCGPRTRLRDFLTSNEASARETIHELGEIRAYAIAEPTSTIEDLAKVANVPFLRDEYFDDVPETAEFLRPDNLLSLFANRCFLRYDDERSRLQVHIPAVEDPAESVWRVGEREIPARSDPSWFTIDAAGFARWIDVHLEGPRGRRTKRIAGISDWGLYDQRRESFVELDLRNASERRMGDYLLVAPHSLHMTRSGFLEDFPENQVERLADGTRCFVTRLSPARPDGSLALRWVTPAGDLRAHTITFTTSLSVRRRTMFIDGVERPMGDPSLPWYFLRPGPYPPIAYAALPRLELTKMNNQGSASAYARLRRYTEEGVIVARPDGAWRLDRERARVRRDGDILEVNFLGLPTHVWALGSGEEPLSLEIIGENGLTYLRTTWPGAREGAIRGILGRYGVDVVSS